MLNIFPKFLQTLEQEAKAKGVAANHPVMLTALGYESDDNSMIASLEVQIIAKYEAAEPVWGTDFTAPGVCWLKLKTDATATELWQYVRSDSGTGKWVRRYEQTAVFNASASNLAAS